MFEIPEFFILFLPAFLKFSNLSNRVSSLFFALNHIILSWYSMFDSSVCDFEETQNEFVLTIVPDHDIIYT